MTSLRTTVLAACAAAAVAIGGAASVLAEDTIRIATEGAFPPFNTIDAEGNPQGFDVDIANALCAEMGADCEIVVQDWDGILPGLLAKKYDAIVASMSITPERQESVAFTDPYYSNKLRFVAPAGSDIEISPEALADKTIGAQRATISAQWVEETVPEADVRLYGTAEEAFLDLGAGRLDVVLNDAYVTYDWLKSPEGEGFEFVGDPVYDDDKVGIAVRKEDTELLARLNAALDTIVDNGTYAEINEKYFPFSIY